MSLEPFGRRELFAGTGGALLCTLAGQKIFAGEQADVEQLASEVPVPPKVRAAERAGSAPAAEPTLARVTGARREYWIQAEPVRWNIVPTGRDGMMDKKVKGKTKFDCLRLPAVLARLRRPARPGDDPRPVDRGGDRRRDRRQLPQQDRHPGDDPPARGLLLAGDGRRLQGPPHRSRRVRAEEAGVPVRLGGAPGHRGRLALPRPRADGSAAGPQGPLRSADRASRRSATADARVQRPLPRLQPDRHRLQPQLRLRQRRAPTRATRRPSSRTSATRVAFNVYAIDNDFHTFHIHGHRWTDETGTVVDNKTLGPGDSFTAAFTEDNPGRWFYHCHVFSHLHEGMNGWYLVS